MNNNSSNVWIVILAWNGKKWLDACLQSLAQCRRDMAYKILIVDNGSTDDSADFVRENHPEVTLIQTGKNLGFAGGNNIGIAHALQNNADYILLLNQDTVVFGAWMDHLIEFADASPHLGILGPFQYDYSGQTFDRVFQNQLTANTTYFEDAKQNKIAPYYTIPHVIGAAMLLRREAIEALGTFDPYYFLYFEEKDLCRRTIAAGYDIAVVPTSKIGHYHGQLHAEELKVTDVDGYFLRNRQVFILKDPTQPFLKNLYIYFRYGLPNSILRKYDTPATPPSLCKAIWTQIQIVVNLPRIFLRRFWECRRIAQHKRTG
ncbi:MAG: glycosyltransferase family 2 protein [Candidatus Latescibacteria bacterium]|jgi:GT2 family glycosyltransferase|nr:glycosyltransferase family 2 protein [Candidatus Latescibacterota bacterium]MBT5829198.1 glycosyltransferase family 2 protein [Candidatus Latescibacterota bacterium]